MTRIKAVERTQSTNFTYVVSVKPSQGSCFKSPVGTAKSMPYSVYPETVGTAENVESAQVAAKPRSAIDSLPEDTNFRDKGCKWFYACLNCPFPDCLYTSSKLDKNQIVLIRDAAMVNLYQTQDVTFQGLAVSFKTSVKTVYRVFGHRKFSHP